MNLASANRRPWYMMNHPRSGRNPFDSLGTDYCMFCQRETEDTDTEAHHQNGTYVYRRRCNRCGHVVNWGIYSAPLVNGGRTPGLLATYQKASTWVWEPGQDRS